MTLQHALRVLLPALGGNLSERDARNAFYIWAATLIGIPVLIVTAAVDYAYNTPWLALIKIVGTWLGLLNLVVLYWRRDVVLAENVMLVVLLGLLVAVFYGNVEQTGPYWFCVFPPIAFFLKGPRRGLLWSGGLIGLVLLLGGLSAAGLVPSSIPRHGVLLLGLSLVVLTLLLAISQCMLAAAETRLEQRTAQLGREVLERLSVEQTLRRTEEKLRFLANRDALTGLPTRALLYDRIEQALQVAARSGERLGLLVIDAAGFSAINRHFGYALGDQVLALVGERLQQALPAGDTVARIGGDAFGVLAWGVDGHKLELLEHQLARVLRAPYEAHGCTLAVEFNIGSALLVPGCDIDHMFRYAESSLTRARAATA
jgi:diguanylate cyclase (GGDEF)-like protein